MLTSKYDIATILGATATGKTKLAVHLANRLRAEIISADSRQVYREMDIGTGKDIKEYNIDGRAVPYHMINIVDAGYQYSVYEYQRDFLEVYKDMKRRSIFPILCGGSGMYIDSVLKGYRMLQVPIDKERRLELSRKSLDELTTILLSYKQAHNTSDTINKKRTIRAIEIEEYYRSRPESSFSFPKINSLIIGIKFDRDSRRQRITERLKKRVDNGMIDEVKRLLNKKMSPESLIYYGLEYKYITQHITGEITYREMFDSLETAIHQFAKRQMTWFRRMEKQGFDIHWIDGYTPIEKKIEKILHLLQ